MPPPVFASLEPKLKDYRGGYGTVSKRGFFECLIPVVVVVVLGLFFSNGFAHLGRSPGKRQVSSLGRQRLTDRIGLIPGRPQA